MKKLYFFLFICLLFSVVAFSAPLQQGSEVHLMRMNLYDFNTDGNIYRMDGTFAQYGDEYSNDVDGEDGRKMKNPGVNVCLLRNHINLVVERRHSITSNDTLFFNIWGLQRKIYLMKFVGVNLQEKGLEAYLEDSYLHTSVPVSLTDTTNIKIEINSDPASAISDRFRLVFKMKPVAPVVHFTVIHGQQVLLNWSGRDIDSVKKYLIQRSSNGTDFTDIETLTAPLFLTQNYQWADPFPMAGFYYYRIKSLRNSGEVAFSNIIATKMPETRPVSIFVFPNPAKANNLNLKMENQPAGKYQISVFNSFGQSVMQSSFDFAGGVGIQKIDNRQFLLPGIYHIQIVKPNGDKQMLEVVF
jgi:hypothetical protein